MAQTDRKFYCHNLTPYVDSPQRIGHGATISAPHMHAYALELLQDHLKPGNRVLDVGSGSGYLTACFARYLNGNASAASPANGIVVGIEHHPELVKLGLANVKSDDPALLDSKQV